MPLTTTTRTALPSGDLMRKPIEELTADDVGRMTPDQRAMIHARCMTGPLLQHVDRLNLRALTDADRLRAEDRTEQVRNTFQREYNIWFYPEDQKFTETVSAGSQQAAWTSKVRSSEELSAKLLDEAQHKLMRYGLLSGQERAVGNGQLLFPIFVAKEQITMHPVQELQDGRFTVMFEVKDKRDPSSVLSSGTMSGVLIRDPFDATGRTVVFTAYELEVGKLVRRNIGFPGISYSAGLVGGQAEASERALVRGEMMRRGWLVS